MEGGEQFGRLLHERRAAVGLSQIELATRCGIDAAYISLLERGRRPPPSRHILLTLSEELGLTASETDEWLYACGLAPQQDYRTLWLASRAELASLRARIERGVHILNGEHHGET